MLRIPDVPGVTNTHEARCSSPPLWDPGGLATLHPHLTSEKTRCSDRPGPHGCKWPGQAAEAKSSGLAPNAGQPLGFPSAGQERAAPASLGVDFLESLQALGDLRLPPPRPQDSLEGTDMHTHTLTLTYTQPYDSFYIWS